MPAKYTSVELICEQCGTRYVRPLSAAHRSRRHFCGPACYTAARALTPDRFWSRVDKNGPIPAHRPELGSCWLWTAATFAAGYGMLTVGGETRMAHRVAYELAHGPIPGGLLICHACDRPGCVNPSHLFLGTHADNSEDMVAKDRAAHFRGAQNAASKLTDDAVRDIRRRYAAGGVLQRELAEEYGVAFQTISKIVRGNEWKHIA